MSDPRLFRAAGGKPVEFPVCHRGGYIDPRLRITPTSTHLKFEFIDCAEILEIQYLTLEEIFAARSILVEIRK